jgi:hypothetical protein
MLSICQPATACSNLETLFAVRLLTETYGLDLNEFEEGSVPARL